MAKDHWIPAAFLGRFAVVDESRALRKREILVMRKEKRFWTSAEKIGYKNGLYDMDDCPEVLDCHAADKQWELYEADLPRVLDLAIEGTLSAKDLDILHIFLAAMMVRHPEFQSAYMRGLECIDAELKELLSHSSFNLEVNRSKDMSSFYNYFKYSQLHVWHSEADFVTSDMGYTVGSVGETLQLYVPIGPRELLIVYTDFQHDKQPLVSREGVLSSKDVKEINTEMARVAREFVAGSENALKTVDPKLIGETTSVDIYNAIYSLISDSSNSSVAA